MFLHAKHATDHGHSYIVIKSSDTGVEVLACYFKRFINSGLLFLTGTSARSRIVDITSVFEKFDPKTCDALPGFHAITGCDTVSALSGRGKSKAFDIISKSLEFSSTLSTLV